MIILYFYNILQNPKWYFLLQNRLWRKNRRPNAGSSCVGTDLNRNFPFQWMVDVLHIKQFSNILFKLDWIKVVGSSSLPCSDVFAGPSALSEPESIAVLSSINIRQGDWDAYFTVHAYGNFWYD